MYWNGVLASEDWFSPSSCRALITATPSSRVFRGRHLHRYSDTCTQPEAARDHVTPALRELHWLPVAALRNRVQTVSTGTQSPRRSYTRLHHRFAHTSRQHSNTLVTAHLQQWRSSSTANRAENRGPCIFRGCTSCI